MADIRQSPVIDIVQRGEDLLIRTEADVRPEDVRVEVHDGMLEVRVPMRALRTPSSAPQPREREANRQPERALRGGEPPFHPAESGAGLDAEPPLGVPDEQDYWNAQKPLISEDRVTSIHLEGFSNEQADEIMEALGDDAPEEAQGGSATGADVFPSHGGFPSRNPNEEEEESS